MPHPTALADSFFAMAEKCRFAVDEKQDYAKALKLYRQASNLGHPRADLRIGEMLERGLGATCDPQAGLDCYKKAAQGGEITAYAALAKLVGRSAAAPKADFFWQKYFRELESGGDRYLDVDEPAASIHAYLFQKLSRLQMPEHFPVMDRYREELIGFIQRYLEHATDPEQLDIMDAVMRWLFENLRD